MFKITYLLEKDKNIVTDSRVFKTIELAEVFIGKLKNKYFDKVAVEKIRVI